MLKHFTEAPIFWHFESIWPMVIKTYASDFTISTVLFQVIDGQLHPIAFHSQKIDKAKINHEIDGKEILEIVSIFKE